MPQGKRNIFFFFCSILLLIQSHAFASSAFAQGLIPQKKPDRLIISDSMKLAPISPILTATTLSSNLIDIIYDGLIEFDEEVLPTPHLAESWTQSKDGLIWTLHIRKGVKFHDGQELTAEDVAFTYEAVKNLKGGFRSSYVFKEIEDIAANEAYVVQITLKKPLAAFLQDLHVGILPKHLLKGKDLTKFLSNEEVVGTGPYKLKSFSEAEAILEANENYFLGKPQVSEIDVQIQANQEMVLAKVIAGEVDFFLEFTPPNFQSLLQIPGYNFYSAPNPYYFLLAFNLKDPILRDLKVRQALNYAIDKEEIRTKALNGQGKIAAGTILPASWAYNPTVTVYPYDPKKATALLKAAGWEDHDGDHLLDKDGKTLQFTLHVNTGEDLKRKALLLIEQQLLDIGIQINVVFFDAANTDFLFEKKFQIVFAQFVAALGPDMSYIFWHGSQIESGFNFSSYNNSEVNRLLEAGRVEADPNKRKSLYFEYQEEIHRDPPGIFLFWTDRLIAVNKRFKGVNIGAIGVLKNIRKWSVSKTEQ